MLLGSLGERFVNDSPVRVSMRGTVRQALRPADLDRLFAQEYLQSPGGLVVDQPTT